MKRIESPANPLYKSVRRLARPRKREPRVLLEGRKLVAAALESGVVLETILVSTRFEGEPPPAPGVEIASMGDALFRKLSMLDSPEGILAVARRPRRSIDELSATGLVVASAGIQDPGNLGAVARVAEAAGADALVVEKGSADPFGPRALRGSMGSLLRIPVFEMENAGALRERGFRIVALSPRGGIDFREVDWRPPVALLLGREGGGLGHDRRETSDLLVTIPMKGKVESLNVATACAVVLYEAVRSRA